jgi:CubicO group peptidase (beta-lactamase class C family)
MSRSVRAVVCAAALLVAAGVSAASAATTQDSGGPPAGMDAHVRRVMEAFEVPGVGLAIVKDGEVVVARGFGVRTLGESSPVDADTRFGIASNTKAFTATAIGILVEDGVLEWDAPVVTYLPWFQMWDPWVTREITVRDLLVHRSGLGLGQGDLLAWPPSDRSREEIARAVRYLEPATSFRSTYAYDNVLFHVAGLVVEAASGQTWEEFVTERIIQPLGMDDTHVTGIAIFEGEDVATPHARVEGTVRPIKPFGSTNTNAAYGINSTPADMARWLIAQLDSGRVEGADPLFTPATTRQLWRPVTPMRIGTPAPELAVLRPNFRGYALGFVVQDYRGHKVVTHSGWLPGHVSRLMLVPDMKLGLMVQLNQESSPAYNAITYWILDQYMGADDTDWVAGYEAVEERNEARLAKERDAIEASRDADSGPSLPLSRYAGTYTDAWYGDVLIEEDDVGLVIRFSRTPLLSGNLEHWNYDTFVARWYDREVRADAFVTFVLAPTGAIEAATLRWVDPATDFSYDFHDLHLKPAPERR